MHLPGKKKCCGKRVGLSNTTWYLVSQHFSLGGRQENYDSRNEYFKFAKGEDGRSYVTFADSNLTKTKKSFIKLPQWTAISKNDGY